MDLFASLDIVPVREQEVKAHVESVQFDGLPDPVWLAQDLSGGCGGKIWESANVMIDYFIWKHLHRESLLFQDKTVLEVGSGTGLVGLAVAKLCPTVKQVILTDQLPMMELMQKNIELNKLDQVVKAKILNWGEPVPKDLSNIDVILASDCIYLEVAFIPLIETLFELTHQDAIIYLAYRKRRSADKRFFQLARKKFIFEDIQDDPQRAVYSRKGIHLFTVKRK
ncbi:MAG: putative methyltransferase-domain-containing protein [Benjaminiella poitrasii]|nr:MAG: putative methyltransferase-domain-containing protein [Benjaminiella poitrasii]